MILPPLFRIVTLFFPSPQMLRYYFLYDRTLLADLTRLSWETMKAYMGGPDSFIHGCACSIQTFGDFLSFNPHCHIIIAYGCFYGTQSLQI